MSTMAIDTDLALERALNDAAGDWLAWRALRLSKEPGNDLPSVPDQDGQGGFVGPSGRISPGATGEALCHLVMLGLDLSGPAVVAADWLQEARTPAEAWLDAPEDVPGELDTPAAGRVWATASATCGLLSVAREPGPRALDLLRGEADMEGRFTGGAYPTFAAAGAYWLAEGPKTEIAEWALRWAREADDDEGWGPWERASALRFWAAADIPPEHATVDRFLESLRAEPPSEGFEDLELTVLTLELISFFED